MKRVVWLVLAIAAVVFPFAAPSASKAEGGDAQVTLSVTGGNLKYELSGGTMTPISFDYNRTSNTVTKSTLTLTVDDARGTFEGWAIDIESSGFEYSGAAIGSNDIPATYATLIPGLPTLLAGSTLDGVRPGDPGTLDSKRTVIVADAGTGSGEFTQDIELLLDIPAFSPAGTYTALLTVSASAAPGSTD